MCLTKDASLHIWINLVIKYEGKLASFPMSNNTHSSRLAKYYASIECAEASVYSPARKGCAQVKPHFCK